MYIAEQAEPDNGAEGQPPALVPRLFQAHQDPDAGEPADRLERIGGEDHTKGEELRRQGRAKPGEPLGITPTTDDADELGGHRDECPKAPAPE